MSSNPKEIPKKLQDDLNNKKIYKSTASSNTNASKLSKVFDDSKERAMYDEIFGSMLRSKDTNSILSTTPAAATAKANNSNNGMITNTDFTTSLLNRLKLVENEAKNNKAKLAEQLEENETLKLEINHLRTLVRDPSDLVTEIQTLKEENELLHNQIDEMEAFLGDYGLQWVGHNQPDHRFDEPDNTDSLADNEVACHPIAYADFVKAIDSLNDIIYSEPTQVVVSGGHEEKKLRKARLAHASELVDNVKIIYYKNGIMVKNGPFRRCGTEEYRSFMKDVMEGYFPSEFKAEYPDGVVFDLKDSRDNDYVEGQSGSNLTKTQFLNRLPKTVIHKGEVVGFRSDIAARLGSDNNNSKASAAPQKIILDTPAAITQNNTKLQDNTPSTPHSMGQLVKIQVKWIDRSIFIATMYEMNTIKDLKEEISKHINSLENIISNTLDYEFELRAAYPPKLLLSATTLLEAGLVPNGTVHARKI